MRDVTRCFREVFGAAGAMGRARTIMAVFAMCRERVHFVTLDPRFSRFFLSTGGEKTQVFGIFRFETRDQDVCSRTFSVHSKKDFLN